MAPLLGWHRFIRMRAYSRGYIFIVNRACRPCKITPHDGPVRSDGRVDSPAQSCCKVKYRVSNTIRHNCFCSPRKICKTCGQGELHRCQQSSPEATKERCSEDHARLHGSGLSISLSPHKLQDNVIGQYTRRTITCGIQPLATGTLSTRARPKAHCQFEPCSRMFWVEV